MQHNISDLIALFANTFETRYQTILVKGDDEPIYLPADEHHPMHRIVFAHGYFASALHEIAHWCIAGPARRLLEDFGYWYCPDGRSAVEQKAFEQVEVKPQALEWAFSVACGKRFNLSADNLSGEATDDSEFRVSVEKQVQYYLHHGFSERAEHFIAALCQFYGQPYPLREQQFNFQKVDVVSV
ncbi:elongation factor P hydroxylase [Thalassotalea agarivorans]|uniref:Elongation factor P hydroxylase n=1 Tax=Thalassotalea agarivorans TaxID=349064 RepID=A0A1H9ZMD4_THASX|nr:elongation factor P hydroxylase [Thalassotalea agarivorans]SES82793.1 hypothetical protein SAMN05660429_00512 [Thalassotalea agarivorans]